MKKKFLLAVIPALMVLTSCAGAGQKAEVKNDNLFVEDTLAHEEIFGESKIEFIDNVKAPLKAPSGPQEPVYGVQYQESGDNVHMRFIAAIWLAHSSIEVEWTRTMYKGHDNGGESGHVFKAEADKACTKAYTSLANGSEDPVTIAQINSQYGDGDDYNYFVVYTMLNIPKTTYADYSIRANIKMNDMASATGIAATVGQTAYATFNLGLTGHFISGKFNNVHDEYNPVYDEVHVKGSDNAVYYDLEVLPGDTLALVYYDDENNVFLLNGTSRFINASGYYFNNSKKTMTALFKGTFTLYLNGSDQIHTVPSLVVRPVYVHLDSWWFVDSASVALCAYDSSDKAGTVVYYTWNAHQTYLETPVAIDPEVYDTLKVIRVGSGESPDVDNPKWGNASNTISFPDAPTYSEVYHKVDDCLWVSGGSDPRDISWGTRS